MTSLTWGFLCSPLYPRNTNPLHTQLIARPYCFTMVALRGVKKKSMQLGRYSGYCFHCKKFILSSGFLSTSIKLTSSHVTRTEFQALLVLTVTSQLYPNYSFLKRDQKMFLSPRQIGEESARIFARLVEPVLCGIRYRLEELMGTGWKRPLILKEVSRCNTVNATWWHWFGGERFCRRHGILEGHCKSLSWLIGNEIQEPKEIN